MFRSYPYKLYAASWIKGRLKYIIPTIIIFVLIDYFGLYIHLFETDYEKFSYPVDLPMANIIANLKMGKEPSHRPINKYDYVFTIKNENKCHKINSKEFENIVILYIVKSALNHQDRRNVIRQTWGWEKRFSDVSIKTIFIVGFSDDRIIQAKILEEFAQNKDMVQADFIDSYYNNTIKTLMGFRWVIDNCSKAQFIVFSDDDVYISTKNMLKFARNPFNARVGSRKQHYIQNNYIEDKNELYSQNRNKGLIPYFTNLTSNPVLDTIDDKLFAGYVFFSSPMRHKSSKWYITLDEYPFSKYPPYVTAGAYLLTYSALESMYYTSLYTKHFKFDDVYLGIVAKKCNIFPLHNEHFYFWKKSYSKEGYDNVIASHGYHNPQELKKVWEEQRSYGYA